MAASYSISCMYFAFSPFFFVASAYFEQTPHRRLQPFSHLTDGVQYFHRNFIHSRRLRVYAIYFQIQYFQIQLPIRIRFRLTNDNINNNVA